MDESRKAPVDVLIAGAGMAGLVAARALGERGLRVVVLEALQRVGGRVFTVHAGRDAVELGAEFVHGLAPELWALIEEAGLQTTEREGTMLSPREGGGLECGRSTESMFSALDELTGYQGPDKSFLEWLDETGVGAEERGTLLGFVEGFNAADARRIGICGLAAQQKAEQELEGERAFHVRGGYGQLVEYLAARVRELHGEILLGRVAERVEWSRGAVQVQCGGGERFAAKRCVLTLPLAVLQRVNNGGVVIEPEPTEQLSAARELAMGHAARFTMRFRMPWWMDADAGVSEDELQKLSFLFTPEELPTVWWTRYPEPGAAVLTGWVGGPRSAKLGGRPVDELAQIGCSALARAFGVDEEIVKAELVSTETHDWSGDPMFLGAYSYVPAGALDAPARLAQAVEDTLYFAGEHTDVTGNWGTVHAAIRSGLRAAEQVLGEV